MNGKRTAIALVFLMLVSFAGGGAAEEDAPMQWAGSDFSGGGAGRYGSAFWGLENVNMVYSEESGMNSMQLRFRQSGPEDSRPLFLYLLGRDDERARATGIEISINGHVLFQGPSTFSNSAWQLRRFELPEDLLGSDDNRLVIANQEEAGPGGMPPWFMVGYAAIADESFQPAWLDELRLPEYEVKLPEAARPMPTPLPGNRLRPGFAIRGTKGWNWTAKQYLEEIPVLAANRMNFLMNCYLSMFSHHPELRNDWWEPLSPTRREEYRRVIEAAREAEVDFCFAIHPQLFTSRPLDPQSDDDFEKLWSHFAWAQEQGVRWFSLSLDDIHIADMVGAGEPVVIDGALHAGLVNRLIGRLRKSDPEAQMIFCPTWYWGTGDNPDRAAYLRALGRELQADVFVFWTGPEVVSPSITRADAEAFGLLVGNRIVLWDNYPVNDNHATLHLGPVRGRDRDLHEVLTGYMGNPHAKENRINRLPLITAADYAFNPWDYDPDRSIGQAILQLAETPEQKQLLKELVEAYPGMLFFRKMNPALNPIRERFSHELMANPKNAEERLEWIGDLRERLEEAFPRGFPATREALLADREWMKTQLTEGREAR